MKKPQSIPKILLIGAGRFGLNHLRVWQELEKDNKIVLAGVVVRSKQSKENLEREFGVRAFTKLTSSLLKEVDGVDIVTPAETHLSIIRECAPRVPIFVEKPIVETEHEAEELMKLQKRH